MHIGHQPVTAPVTLVFQLNSKVIISCRMPWIATNDGILKMCHLRHITHLLSIIVMLHAQCVCVTSSLQSFPPFTSILTSFSSEVPLP